MSRRIPPTPVAAPWNGSTAEGWLCDSTLNATASPSPRSITPAFSPGPCSTRPPAEGSRFSSRAECLYPQCSDQSSEKTASSKWLGSRSSSSTMREYSELVRPSASWRDCSETRVRCLSLAASQDESSERWKRNEQALPRDADRARPDLGRLVPVHQGRGARAHPRDADHRAPGPRGTDARRAGAVHGRHRRDRAAVARQRVVAGRGRAREHGDPVLAALVG